MSGWNPPPGSPGGPPPSGSSGSPYGGDPGYGQQPGGYGRPGPQPGFGGPAGGPPPYGGQSPYQPPPPPPRKSSSTGLVIGLVGGGAALVIVIVVVAAVIYTNSATPKHDIVAAPSAGGLSRDTSAEKSLGSQISRQKHRMRSATNGKVDDLVSAIYDEGGTDDLGQPKRILFLGGTGDIGDPEKFVSGFRSTAQSRGTVTEVKPGAGGGKGVCVQLSISGEQNAVCAWATSNSFGEIVPLSSGHSAQQVAKLMRLMRPDLEHEVS